MTNPIDPSKLFNILHANQDRITSGSQVRHIDELINYSKELDQKLKARRTPQFRGGKAELIEEKLDFDKIPEKVVYQEQEYNLRAMVQQLLNEVKQLEKVLSAE